MYGIERIAVVLGVCIVIGQCSTSPSTARSLGVASIVFSVITIVFTVLIAILVFVLGIGMTYFEQILGQMNVRISSIECAWNL